MPYDGCLAFSSTRTLSTKIGTNHINNNLNKQVFLSTEIEFNNLYHDTQE